MQYTRLKKPYDLVFKKWFLIYTKVMSWIILIISASVFLSIAHIYYAKIYTTKKCIPNIKCFFISAVCFSESFNTLFLMSTLFDIYVFKTKIYFQIPRNRRVSIDCFTDYLEKQSRLARGLPSAHLWLSGDCAFDLPTAHRLLVWKTFPSPEKSSYACLTYKLIFQRQNLKKNIFIRKNVRFAYFFSKPVVLLFAIYPEVTKYIVKWKN